MSSLKDVMETIDQKNSIQRRSFILRLLSSATGIGVLGSLMPGYLKSKISWKKKTSIQVNIHPQAVSRANKDFESRGH
jgi:hypothetical protein